MGGMKKKELIGLAALAAAGIATGGAALGPMAAAEAAGAAGAGAAGAGAAGAGILGGSELIGATAASGGFLPSGIVGGSELVGATAGSGGLLSSPATAPFTMADAKSAFGKFGKGAQVAGQMGLLEPEQQPQASATPPGVGGQPPMSSTQIMGGPSAEIDAAMELERRKRAFAGLSGYLGA